MPEDDAERRAPSEDPQACSRCGVHIGFGSDEYCDPCAREVGAKPPMQRCMVCGRDAPQEEMETVDVSPPDEYYPDIQYLCRSCSGADDGLRADGGTPQGSMNIQKHDGDPIREAVNRAEYVPVMAYGEVAGNEVLLDAYVSEHDTPTLDVHAGGEWFEKTEEYVGGRTVSREFERLWNLDKAFGALFRKHELDYVHSVTTASDSEHPEDGGSQ